NGPGTTGTASHSTVTSTGIAWTQVGSILSPIVTTCVTSIEFPQSSVTRYVRVIISGQVFLSLTSPTCVTTGVAVQLPSSSVTTLTSGAGTSAAHATVTGAGLDAVGSISSSTI